MLQIVSRLNTEQFDTKIDKTLPFLDFRIYLRRSSTLADFSEHNEQHGKNQ